MGEGATGSPRLPNLWLRARILQGIRAFFVARGYLEVETPHRVPAPLPEAHIDAPPAGGWFLHPSPEACMKRLVAAGAPRVFQICRCFRDGERGARHLPEFTLLEWYRAGVDYRALMAECEELLVHLLATLGRGPGLPWRGNVLDLAPPWPRFTVAEAFARWAGTTPAEALAAGTFDELVAFRVEPGLGALGRPAFLVDYPAECAALARRRADAPHLAERFELYLGGLELANAFSELTDPAEQAARFERERQKRRRDGRADYPWPERFLADLARLPPCAGIALGVDRLVMLLAGAETIDQVVAFTPEEL